MDARREKNRQRREWDAAAPGWKKWLAVLEPAFAPVTDALLELTGVAPGDWVLDVGCGLGDTTLAAARRVGPDGRVVGIDLSPRMLALAEQRAKNAGVANVGFKERDAEELAAWPEASYDVALSRFGLPFLPELGVALRGVHRLLVRGGRFASAAWPDPDLVPFLSVARRAVAAYLGPALPSPDAPGPFALAKPGRLEQALSSAGFTAIRGERVEVVVELPSAEAYVQLVRDAGSLGRLVDEHATADPAEIWRSVEGAAAAHAGADGRIAFACQATCVAATKGR
jgi:enediyne biosynthesis protein CalE5